MHPFWSSHEEKRVCVGLSMGGGHGRSWHDKLVGEMKEGAAGGAPGEWEGCKGGAARGGSAWGCLCVRCCVAGSGCCSCCA
jgi:hypothetical protein